MGIYRNLGGFRQTISTLNSQLEIGAAFAGNRRNRENGNGTNRDAVAHWRNERDILRWEISNHRPRLEIRLHSRTAERFPGKKELSVSTQLEPSYDGERKGFLHEEGQEYQENQKENEFLLSNDIDYSNGISMASRKVEKGLMAHLLPNVWLIWEAIIASGTLVMNSRSTSFLKQY